MTFPKKTPDEIKLLTFDFSTEAATGTTLSAPVFTVTHLSGAGVAGDLDLDNLSIEVVQQTVIVLVGAGLDGAKYRISCEVDASNGEHHQIDKDLPVADKAALIT